MGGIEITLLVITGIVVPLAGLYMNHIRAEQKDQADQTAGMERRIAQVEKQYQDLCLDVARNFVTKSEIREMSAGIIDWLRRIDEKLDRKADKGP